MSTKFTLATIFLLMSLHLMAQQDPVESEEQKVKDVIHTIFEGMRLGDSTMIRQVLNADVEFYSVFMTTNGESKLRSGNVQAWLDAIGTPHEEVWNEEWWDPVIQVENNFAHAWTPYAFYIGDEFSHCGVDSFHMIKEDDGKWKVFHLTDTRKKSGCEEMIPDFIKGKHQK